MRSSQILVTTLAERLCRPQRIGVFGHRGVGKTTLLTMLYREAVGGRLPGLRLAAADARTAEYLSDKILQLESGQTLPGTLAETDLRFHLYHGSTQVELLFKDYQGEHVELGREEPIREYFRDCDAAWLCLEPPGVSSPADRLRRQQEIEQLVEDYLSAEAQPSMDRPIALVLTKADLLPEPAADVEQWAGQLGMTRHALQTHCPNRGLFAVSSLGQQEDHPNASNLVPTGLAELLLWLTTALQAQDEARLGQLWSLTGTRSQGAYKPDAPAKERPSLARQACESAKDGPSLARQACVPVLPALSKTGGRNALLARCVECFARRYPAAPAADYYLQLLREQQRRSRRRRWLLGAAAAACLLAGLGTYDAQGYQQASRFQAEHAGDPAAVLDRWQHFRAWHPTRNWLLPSLARAEEDRLRELGQEARQQECARGLADLRRLAADADADPEAVWQQFRDYHADFPEAALPELEPLRSTLKTRRDDQVSRRARLAYDELLGAEQRSADLSALADQADRFLRDYPDSASAADVRRHRESYLLRLDERDMEVARDYSAHQPLDFPERIAHYQQYLDKHTGGGIYTSEAALAVQAIAADWDKHDFRLIRDQFQANPGGDIPALVTRCRTYLAVHPEGQFAASASELLRWSERVTSPGAYRVVLRNGHFDKSVAHFFSRGPDLSVELEVNGVRYGPSTILTNRYDPEWNYEFPRPITWKVGEPVRIRVTDHDWKDRVVLEISSVEGDPLALQLMTGEVWAGPHRLTFESDFALPVLPRIE